MVSIFSVNLSTVLCGIVDLGSGGFGFRDSVVATIQVRPGPTPIYSEPLMYLRHHGIQKVGCIYLTDGILFVTLNIAN